LLLYFYLIKHSSTFWGSFCYSFLNTSLLSLFHINILSHLTNKFPKIAFNDQTISIKSSLFLFHKIIIKKLPTRCIIRADIITVIFPWDILERWHKHNLSFLVILINSLFLRFFELILLEVALQQHLCFRTVWFICFLNILNHLHRFHDIDVHSRIEISS